MVDLIGTGVALVTPFKEDGSIDFEGLLSLLEFTGAHVNYFVVMGTTGESATCTSEEKQAILNFVRANNPNNLPIVYGIGGNNTMGVVEQIENTDLTGVSAILSVSPYYNKPSQNGLIAHYRYIADRSPLPIILYNVPGRTGSNMLAETTLALADHANIIGVKEAVGQLEQTEQIANNKPKDFLLISGDDLLTGDMMAQGGVGAISVLANGFPKEFSDAVNYGLASNYTEAKAKFETFNAINPLMYIESNPVGVKEVLRIKGVCGNQVRLPLVKSSLELSQKIEALLA